MPDAALHVGDPVVNSTDPSLVEFVPGLCAHACAFGGGVSAVENSIAVGGGRLGWRPCSGKGLCECLQVGGCRACGRTSKEASAGGAE